MSTRSAVRLVDNDWRKFNIVWSLGSRELPQGLARADHGYKSVSGQYLFGGSSVGPSAYDEPFATLAPGDGAIGVVVDAFAKQRRNALRSRVDGDREPSVDDSEDETGAIRQLLINKVFELFRQQLCPRFT